ncbi:tektin-5 [Oreochromis niloticus]|uniref:tektin-5 n=1 Tax=Oreochromis niloticus TaxID=8128 RepID=UPI000393FBB2|nr:tektin-5 [Oreochromis niloticus]XP_005478577.1 tektin-5 [Oreochromis niloticus]
MWAQCVLKDNRPCLNVRFSMPVLSSNKILVSSNRPKSKETNRLEDEIVYNLGEDISWMPSATRSTMRYLSSRHREVSQWQAQFSEIMRQLEREVTALEQLKDIVDSFLQEMQLSLQLLSDCISVVNSLSPAVLSQDPVYTELRKEERLTNDSGEILRAQVCILLSKISSLKNIHSQLGADLHNKGEATKFTMKCMTLELNTPSSCPPAGQYKPHHVGYDTWLSHCKDLKTAANILMKDSSSFRGNLRFSMANIKNAQKRQRRRTDDALRKKIHELTKNQEMLLLERKQISDDISDQTKEIQKLKCEIRSCDTKLHHASHRLDILNQRPGYELCRDLPHISLTLENYDLVKIGAGLRSTLKLSHQNLELQHKHLMIVEEKLAKKTHILEVEQKCQSLLQTFQPAHDTVVVLANKAKLHKTTSSSGCHECFQ